MRTYFLKRGHPALTEKCGLCQERFKQGDEVAMLNLQPMDEEQRQRMIDGKPYTSVTAQLAHVGCM